MIDSMRDPGDETSEAAEALVELRTINPFVRVITNADAATAERAAARQRGDAVDREFERSFA